MALSAGANITGLNHTLQQLITQLALYKLGNPREGTQNRESFTLITGTEQHKNANYWYRTSNTKLSIICTGVVGLVPPAARTINYHLVCFALLWQFSMY